MIDRQRIGATRLALPDLRQIDEICDAFEAAIGEDVVPPMAPYLERVAPAARSQLLAELAAIARHHLHSRGVADPNSRLIELNPAFANELASLLDRDSAATIEFDSPRERASDMQGGRLPVRCPSCHTPVEVAVDTQLTDLTCGSCGSHFSLIDQELATRMAPTLSKMGRFDLVERIGIGGFGTVWKARDKELDRTVAVKVPRRGDMTPEETEKFFREARAAAQLRHPNIVSVHEVGRAGDTVFIVSDFVRGVTLGDWLTGQQPTGREAAELCAKIADALHHAHEKGVVHRDLKPANIMIDDDGEPHIMDFGLARREVGEVTLTVDGQVLGTPAYMPPEQAAGEAHKADRRSDVYSLGVILFQLLTGELPFRGNARMMIHQVLHDEPPSPRTLNGNISKDLATVTLKCLEKLPGKRFPTAQHLAADLRRHVNGEPIHSRPINAFGKLWRGARRRPASFSLAALLAILAILGPVIAVRQTLLQGQRDKFAVERELALSELDDKNEQLRDQLATNILERAAVEFDAGKTPEAVAMLATAYSASNSGSQLRSSLRQLIAGWSAELPLALLHDETVRAVAFSPDGRLIATGGYDKTVRFWEARTGKPLSTILRHDGAVRGLAFSPDGKRVLTGCEDTFARLWEVETGIQVGQPFAIHVGVRGVAFDPDGTRFIAAGGDGVARICDVESGNIDEVPFAHEGEIVGVAFSPDGERIATGSDDFTSQLWSLKEGKAIGSRLQHKGKVKAVAFSPDGDKLLTAGWQDSPKLWDARTGNLIRELPGQGFVYAGVFSPDGKLIFLGCLDGDVAIVDADTGDDVRKPFHQRGQIVSVAVSPDGSLVACGSTDAIARVWQMDLPQRTLARSHAGRINDIAISADGSRMATVSDDQTACLWNAKTLAPIGQSLVHGSAVMRAIFSPDSKMLITFAGDQTARYWDAASGRPLKEPVRFAGFPTAVGFDSDQRLLLAASADQSLLITDVQTGLLLGTLEHPVQGYFEGAFDRSGRLLATAARDMRLRIWNLETFALNRTELRVESTSSALDFSPDGKRLACGYDGLTIWNLETGESAGDVADAGKVVYALVYSPSGRVVLTGDESGSARFWEGYTGKPATRFMAHHDWVMAVAFDSRGRFAFTGCQDGTITQWPAPPEAMRDSLDYIRAWTMVRTGLRPNAQGRPRRITLAEWNDAQRELEQLENSRN